MSDDLLSVEDMAEIPKDVASAQGKRGCSKGVNLFLARQKLIADMMEEEDTDPTAGGAGGAGGAVRVSEGAVASKSEYQPAPPQSVRPQGYVMITAEDKKKKSAEAISEIPDPTISESGSSKSKGVNLFLARQKLIADMMAAEEEEEKAAEEAKIREAEEKRKQEELRQKQEEERIKLEELKRKEREKLEESERKKAARAAKFKTNKIPTTSEPEKNRSTSQDITLSDQGDHDEDTYLRISESPPDTPQGEQLLPLCKSGSDQSVDPQDLPDLVLPKSQPPTVTLLQKSRAGEIPKGALYVGTRERIEGGYKHSEQFFLVSAIDQTHGQESTEKAESRLIESQRHSEPKESKQNFQSENSRAKSYQAGQDPNNNAVAPPSLSVDTEFNRSSPRKQKVKPPVKKKPTLCKPSTPTSSSQPFNSSLANSGPEDAAMVVDTLAHVSQSTASPHSQYLSALSIDEEEEGCDNPFITGSSQSTPRSCSVASNTSLSSPRLQYKEIQKGGEIPFSGLRKPAPVTPPRVEKPRNVPEPIAGYDRSPAPLPRVERDRCDARRKELLCKVEEEERRKKAREEEAGRKARRHSDYFTPKEKSPIPHNRYDGTAIASMSAPQSPAKSSTSQHSPRVIVSEMNKPCTAIALYEFIAQHPREISVHKDEAVSIKRRIDGNWYEVYKNGRSGIIPVTYLQVVREFSLTPPPLRLPPPDIREGSAVARYNFNPQSEAELALRRGDRVSLIKRVDPNWYKGRLQGSITTGIFPVSYLQVISEPVLEENGYWMTRENCSPRSALADRSISAPIGTLDDDILSMKLSRPTSYTPFADSSRDDKLDSNANNNNSSDSDRHGFSRSNDETERTDINQNECNFEEAESCISFQRKVLDMPSYKSLYNYEPQNTDELQLKRGDIVHVIEKCTDGWFVGTSGRTGLFGTFPGNYVTPV